MTAPNYPSLLCCYYLLYSCIWLGMCFPPPPHTHTHTLNLSLSRFTSPSYVQWSPPPPMFNGSSLKHSFLPLLPLLLTSYPSLPPPYLLSLPPLSLPPPYLLSLPPSSLPPSSLPLSLPPSSLPPIPSSLLSPSLLLTSYPFLPPLSLPSPYLLSLLLTSYPSLLLPPSRLTWLPFGAHSCCSRWHM